MSNITLTIPNDDHIALRAFGKALEEMALAHGAEPRKTVGELSYKLNIDTSEATAALERLNGVTGELMQAAPQMMGEPEVDTTAQQVESLAAPMGYDEEQAPSTTDSTGTPWDERIHSTSKVLNADGTWRLRRKPKDMDELEWAAFVESVKGELHTQTPVMTDEEVKTLDPLEIGEPTREEVEPPVTPPGDDFHTDAGVVTEQTVVGIPPIPVPPPVVVAPPVPEVTEWDFPRLMTFLTERHGKIDVATVNTLLAQDGMSSVQELNAHPDKIGPFVARVKAHLGE
ncbi:hypothetical protein kpv79_59 [Klebsiella phage vB_KpnM_KpV79]|uniref:Uncharacterized protein n=1 Tax=Klebsiella phage vB_KpnM_KpV79 TaxID=2041212 RepID=A0A291LBK0_9CAUD|nr:hypothetical protein FDI70_gp59 [Klebsiella phage vB_KpnM_KpV79]ATI16512.1 hypothetical protein kpv79_59 [Klebsiella phage vB_KpnM_KpV79]